MFDLTSLQKDEEIFLISEQFRVDKIRVERHPFPTLTRYWVFFYSFG